MKIKLAAALAVLCLSEPLVAAPAHWDSDSVKSNACLVADWMLNHPIKRSQLDWTYGAFYQGLTALALSDPSLPYLGLLRKFGWEQKWALNPRIFHADDHCIGQTWLELAILDGNPNCAAFVRRQYDAVMANLDLKRDAPITPQNKDRRWNWCDALFMSPTVLTRLGGFTGNPEYWDFMDREYRATVSLLYSREEHLFYRDSRYFDRRTKNGKGVFWARGNGWVFASLAIILRDLPPAWPYRKMYEQLFTEMAAAVKSAQCQDGSWHPSLLDAADPDLPEMSSTAFFTYGMLWGLNNGYLDRKTYLGCARLGWQALCHNINDEGRLGWVQQIGDRPVDSYNADSFETYAAGAFLDAAVEAGKMLVAERHPKCVKVTVENPAILYRPDGTVELPWPQSGLEERDLRVYDLRNGAVVPHQFFDSNNDGKPDQLLFAVPFAGGQCRTFWLFNDAKMAAASNDAVCFGRFAPDRLDDFLWENDKAAYRVYGPAVSQPPPKGEGLVSSGIDVWSKSVSYPVINSWLAKGAYHKDAGEGMDNYKVGPGRGCGGFGFNIDGQWYYSRNWGKQRHLCNGPVRTAFEVTYDAWQCGNGVEVSERRRTTLDVRSHFSRHESVFTIKGADQLTGGPGLDIASKRLHKGIFMLGAAEGWLANYEARQPGMGSIATSVVFPGMGLNVASDAEECVYLTRPVKSGEPVVWYSGSAWSGAGDFLDSSQWKDAVISFCRAVREPLKITVQQ